MNQVLRAFSNPIRLKLIHCIGTQPKNVSQLISVCGLSQSAVSQHLRKLRQSGIVITSRKGKEIYYSLSNTKAYDVSRLLQTFIQEVTT